MKIGIIGMGFVGGTTAKILEQVHQIFPYDKYKEPYNSNQNFENLAKNSEAIFICVPTPMQASGAIDYTNIYSSLSNLLEITNRINRNPLDLTIIIRSTAVSGTTDDLAKKYPFHFAFNPEFLREKHALKDMENTNRIVIGANNEKIQQIVQQIYEPLFPNAKYVLTNTKTSEMIKYAANVILAGQIALANEINQICNKLEINYNEVKNTILLDERIGRNIDVPGNDGDFGFGGKCFPKDLNALIYLARENMYRPYLLEEIWRLNERVRKNKDWLDIKGATSQKNFDESP
ncbi:MAG: nucleotide sugar dehydrogenase [Candidatus Pacearchaeota archaeon]